MSTPTRKVYLSDPFWQDIVKYIDAAERNLNDVQGGYSPTTPGSGNVGGGSGGVSDPTGEAAVQAAQAVFVDVANRDLERLYDLVAKVVPIHRELRALCTHWSYATPGERLDGRKRRTARPTETSENAGRWCNSCLRVNNSCSPVHRTRTVDKDEPPVPLCRWCYDFVSENKVLPPLVILTAHQQGRRISQQAVKQALKDAAPPEVHKPGRKHKANNEHPTRPSIRRRGPNAVIPSARR